MVLSPCNVSTVTACLGAAKEQTRHLAGCICYSSFQTHSWCGAPVFVSRVRTKNMKMTKTARPTQNPITMESGEKEKTDQYFTCICRKFPSTWSMTAKPKRLCILFLDGKEEGQSDLPLSIFKQKTATETVISSLNFTDVWKNQKTSWNREDTEFSWLVK